MLRKYYQSNHNLFDYHFDALEFFQNNCCLKGKRVLEIGGSNLPRELVLDDLGCAQWVSVDVIGERHYAMEQQTLHYKRELIYPLGKATQYLNADSYLIFDGVAEGIPTIFHDSFDVVVSITALEHILKTSTVLEKVYACLKKGGCFLSYHGPVWSSYCGHHIWVAPNLNFNNLGPLPPFAHLLMRPAEVFKLLRCSFPSDVAEEAVQQMFFSERITRLFYEDYIAFMEQSPFSSFSCNPYGEMPVESSIYRKLKSLYPNFQNFSAYGMELIALR